MPLPKTREVPGLPMELEAIFFSPWFWVKPECNPSPTKDQPICPPTHTSVLSLLGTWNQEGNYALAPHDLQTEPCFPTSFKTAQYRDRSYFSSFQLWLHPEQLTDPHILSVLHLLHSPESDALPVSMPGHKKSGHVLAETKLNRLILTRTQTTSLCQVISMLLLRAPSPSALFITSLCSWHAP